MVSCQRPPTPEWPPPSGPAPQEGASVEEDDQQTAFPLHLRRLVRRRCLCRCGLPGQPGDGSGPMAPHHPAGSCPRRCGGRDLTLRPLNHLVYTSSLLTLRLVVIASVVTGAKIAAPSISHSSLAAANSSTTVQASAGVAGAAIASKGERWEGFRKYMCGTQSA